jgi:DNA-cytosine methyltransferase
MKVLSLFSGVGGFDMGLENAGMETVFQCEWDKHANSILYKHWPDVPKWDDVSTLTGKHILAHAPVIDVVAWGSPCQDLSVAGKRAGLEGGRSGLFHEGIRIIKELQEESNGKYPRISIWENVVGALNSNGGADFGIILNEMAEAGAVAIEWSVLDAQYFGIPQRRRRVFVVAIFDPVLASRCPNPLLPVAQSLPGHLAKSKPKRKTVATETPTSIGTDGQWAAGTTPDGDILRTSVTSKWSKGSGGPSGSEYYNMVVDDGAWWDGKDTAEALTTTSNEQRMPDKQRFQAVVEQDVVGALAARDYKGVGNQYVAENKLVTEPYVKSSRAQTSDDSETWIPGQVNPTLNSFDVGDTRATTAIIEPVAYHFDSLSSNSMKSSNPDSGVNEVDTARTLDTWRPDPSLNQGGLAIVETTQMKNNPVKEIVGSLQARVTATNHESIRDGHAIVEELVLFENSFRDGARIAHDGVTQTLTSKMGTGGGNTPMIAIPIQDGREIEKHQNGLGIAETGSPAYTLDQTGAQAVAYSIREDAKAGNFSATELDHANSLSALQPSPQSHHAQMFIAEPTMAVRRLTPLECEKLMGWGADHTRWKADGTEQADTHRYKQAGNGVASPVAQWIAKHILAI